ncbi:hypothetical protein R2325_16965 [Mycobacteroides chelonae]|uniref:hypothetical protein n=1 Tax=Mycobacteroides chelonae TaxID=1774 RepID=UPI002DF2E309|nr:hypothetical protein [Mycobacteroides chelonae]MEC4871703.1 hypothetical protein [Mycobacteroides chelonae]
MLDTFDLQRARLRLDGAVSRLAQAEVAETRIRYRAVENAPDSWEALQAVDLNKGYLPVWNGASGQSVYLSQMTNYSFRYWHDMGHLFYRLSFTPEDEYELQNKFHLPAVADLVGADSLAYRLYEADTVGQIDYVQIHHEFPVNQLAFVMAFVVDKGDALARTF